jgi:hypothetical protein
MLLEQVDNFGGSDGDQYQLASLLGVNCLHFAKILHASGCLCFTLGKEMLRVNDARPLFLFFYQGATDRYQFLSRILHK